MIASAADYRSAADRIADPARIGILLHHLASGRVPLEIAIPGEDVHFTSVIIAVDGQRRVARLDELMPRPGNSLIRAADTFLVRSHLRGIEIAFHGRVTAADADRDGPFFEVPFPDTLLYRQRRAAYRAILGGSLRMRVTVPAGAGRTLAADVRDLSSGGARLLFAQSVAEHMQEGTLLAGCRLHFPSGEPAEVDLQLCFLAAGGKLAGRAAGVRFTSMDSNLRRRLERVVAEADRAAVRRTGATAREADRR
jgi:c-di-GMP-binding flagellar brake protein YcgR